MAVSSVYNNGYNNYLYGMGSMSSLSESGSMFAGNSNAASGSLSSALFSAKGQAAFTKAIAELKQSGKDKITFDDIEKYRAGLEEKFSATVRSDLLDLGVDPDVKFTLVNDANGSLSVICQSKEDKAKIEKYFRDNPEMAEEFEYIQALSNFKKSTDNVEVRDWSTMRDLKKGLQAQAVEIFFGEAQAASGGYASLIGDFNMEGNMTSYMLGLNQTV